MMRANRLLILLLMGVFLSAFASPVLATEDTPETESTETTIAPEEFVDGEGPALVAPPIEETETEQPWTVRFIYPALGGLTVILVVGIVIGYNHKVRNRYKVVG